MTRATIWMALACAVVLNSSGLRAQESAYQFTVGVFASDASRESCPVSLMSAKGDLLARCTPQEPDEGPISYEVSIFSVDGKKKPKVFVLGEDLESNKKDFLKGLKKLNEFLKKHRFTERGQKAAVSPDDITFEGKSVVVRHKGAEYKGSTSLVKLADKNCCDYRGIEQVAVFPESGILVGMLRSECRDNDHETRPCDCDGHYPMGDEDNFRWCPTPTWGTIVLTAPKPKPEEKKRRERSL